MSDSLEKPIAEPRLPLDAPDDPHRLAGCYLESLRGREPLSLRFWRSEFIEWNVRGEPGKGPSPAF